MHQQTIPFKVMTHHVYWCITNWGMQECTMESWWQWLSFYARITPFFYLTTGVHLSNVSDKQLTPREW